MMNLYRLDPSCDIDGYHNYFLLFEPLTIMERIELIDAFFVIEESVHSKDCYVTLTRYGLRIVPKKYLKLL